MKLNDPIVEITSKKEIKLRFMGKKLPPVKGGLVFLFFQI